MMNDEIKTQLDNQGNKIRVAFLRCDTSKAGLDAYDAQTRNRVRADGVKRTEADIEALVISDLDRPGLLSMYLEAKAEYEGAKVETQCLLAKVSLVCSEIAAASRIAQ